MKKQRFLFLLLLSLGGCTADDHNTPIPNESELTSSSSPLGEWTKKANYPGTKTEAPIAFTIANRAYVGMANGATDFWEYDKSKDKWERKSDLGTISNRRVSFSIGNKGYAGLGTAFGFSTNDFYQYDSVTDRWSNVSEYPVTTNELSLYSLGFSIGNKGYVINGENNLNTQMHEYDPAKDTWTKKAGFPIPYLEGSVAFSIGNKGYVGTGFRTIGDMPELINQFWQYDPVTDKWTRLADFGGKGRWLAVGFSIGNKGYIGTGAMDAGSVNKPVCDFWEYNPIKDQWTEKASFKGGERVSAVGFSIGNSGYLGLGLIQGQNNPIQKTTFWEFDPNR